jgi:hypothetical protein
VCGETSGCVTDGETELHILDDNSDDENDGCAAMTDDLHVWKYRPMPWIATLGPKAKAE